MRIAAIVGLAAMVTATWDASRRVVDRARHEVERASPRRHRHRPGLRDDFLTFAVMILVFHAGERLPPGWFVESLATRSQVIFAMRTRSVPFLRSKPSTPPLATPVVCSSTGVLLPFTPLARVFGFVPLLASFLGILELMVTTYVTLVEFGKKRLFRPITGSPSVSARRSLQHRRVHRVATRWSTRPGSHLALEAAVDH